MVGQGADRGDQPPGRAILSGREMPLAAHPKLGQEGLILHRHPHLAGHLSLIAPHSEATFLSRRQSVCIRNSSRISVTQNQKLLQEEKINKLGGVMFASSSAADL